MPDKSETYTHHGKEAVDSWSLPIDNVIPWRVISGPARIFVTVLFQVTALGDPPQVHDNDGARH